MRNRHLSRYRVRRRWWMRAYRYVRPRWHAFFAVLDALGWVLFGPAVVVRRVRGWIRGREEAHAAPSRILLIQLDHLGDAVLSTGLVHVLRTHYPAAAIDVLCSRKNREFFGHLPEVDNVHEMGITRFDRRGGFRWIGEILRYGRRLRRNRYDLAIDVRGEFPHAVLMWLAGARRRLGWRSGGGGFLLTDSPRWINGRHEAQSRHALLKKLGISCRRRDLTPRWPGSEPTRDENTAKAARMLGDSLRAPCVVLHVGAGTPAKRWPRMHWVELLGRLIVELDAQIRLVGGKEDAATAAELLGNRKVQGVTDLTGRLGVADLAEAIQQADLFIGPDSGPAHLAAAVGTPCVVLFSGTNEPKQWAPAGENVAVLRNATLCSPCHRDVCPVAEHPCLVELSPATVIAAARRLLSPPPALYEPGIPAEEPAHAGHATKSPAALERPSAYADGWLAPSLNHHQWTAASRPQPPAGSVEITT